MIWQLVAAAGFLLKIGQACAVAEGEAAQAEEQAKGSSKDGKADGQAGHGIGG